MSLSEWLSDLRLRFKASMLRTGEEITLRAFLSEGLPALSAIATVAVTEP
ncbi:hypothetical protein [Streptomyces sp. ODS28]